MELLILGLLSIGSAAYFIRFAKCERDGVRVWFQPYQIADTIFASLLALLFLYSIYRGLMMSGPIKVNTAVLIDNALFSFLLVGGVMVFLVLRSLNPITVFGLHKMTWKGALISIVALVVAAPVIFFTYQTALHFFGPETKPQELLQFFMSAQTSGSDKALLIFTAVVVAPISEEVIFRGYLYGVIRRYGGRWTALLLSAALFSAIHLYPPAIGALAALAVALTLVYEFTGSLWAPMLMHACFNATTLVISSLWPNLGN